MDLSWLGELLAGVVALLWLIVERDKRKNAEAKIKLERKVSEGLGTLLEEKDETIKELRSKLPLRDRFERLFPPPETD